MWALDPWPGVEPSALGAQSLSHQAPWESPTFFKLNERYWWKGLYISWRVKQSEATHPCPVLCNSMGCSLPGSPVCGFSQARILEQVAISSSRESSWSRGQTHLSCFGRWILYHWSHLGSLNNNLCMHVQSCLNLPICSVPCGPFPMANESPFDNITLR